MPLTARRLWAGLWVMAMALSLVAVWFAFRGDLSVVRLWRDILHWRVGNESWALLQHAMALRPPDGADLYQVVYFEHGIKLSYPPSALLLWQAASALCRRCDAGVLSTALTSIGLALTPIIPIVMAAMLLSAPWMRESTARDRVLTVGGVLALCAAYYPLALANVLGQIQAWLNVLFALAFWTFSRRRFALCGAAIALIVLVKPYAVLLLIWAAVRGHRRLVIAACAVIGVGVGLALVVFGIDSHVGYLRMASVLSERGESLYANQSINGLLNRLFLDPAQVRWENTAPPPYHPAVAIGTSAALVIGTGLALLWPRRRRAAGGHDDLAFISVMMLIASPIGWEHYYPVLLPLYAMFIADSPARADRWEIVLLLTSVTLTGVFLGPLARIESRPWTVLQSYQLAGAVLFLAAVARRIHRASAPRQEPA